MRRLSASQSPASEQPPPVTDRRRREQWEPCESSAARLPTFWDWERLVDTRISAVIPSHRMLLTQSTVKACLRRRPPAAAGRSVAGDPLGGRRLIPGGAHL
ncbi:hypothetical protein NL676_006568 [Syzygium grande]|nr:hypothetical protein NL676_006568 [Syzygium grande]